MPWSRRYLFALLPGVITVGWWQTAVWVFSYFDCKGSMKSLQNCYVGQFDLVPFLEIGFFWMQLFSMVTIPLSALSFFGVFGWHYWTNNIEPHLKKRKTK